MQNITSDIYSLIPTTPRTTIGDFDDIEKREELHEIWVTRELGVELNKKLNLPVSP